MIGIEACEELMPNTPMVAVFDTAFHQTMPKEAFLYALPYELYTENGIRKYGFHGTSHMYVSNKVAEVMGKDIKDLKIVTCHLGNGASLCAVKNGVSIDTTMGFTPLDGIVMGTRSGSIDPAIVLYLINELKYSTEDVNTLLNKKSGVLGISGVSSDFRDIEDAAAKGDERAILALDIYHYRIRTQIGAYAAAMGGVDAIVFTAGVGENGPETREACLEGLELDIYHYRIRTQIGAYAAAMGGVDAIVFTAGVGENGPETREACLEGLEFLGVKVDKEKNNVRGKVREISTEDSTVKAFVIPTNEELVIARDTKNLVK